MSFANVKPGVAVPDDINVIIEIPAYSYPVKYEIDKETGAFTVDRFMGTSMQYPANYGYLPQSLSEDGDPVDILVITPDPLMSRCVIRCRPVGVLKMMDEAGNDSKILAVPVKKLTPHYEGIQSYRDISPEKLSKIYHFFEHYKDLEEGKWVKVEGWFGAEEAKKEILESIYRYKNQEAAED